MNISPNEAEEALSAIQAVMQKTRRAISSSGAYKFLVIWGIIWLLGFLNSQFLPGKTSGYIWIGLDILGGFVSVLISLTMGRGVRTIAPTTTGKRIGIFWLLLILYCVVAVSIAWPIDGKQMSMLITLFATLGWLAMGLLLSFASAWWGLGLLALSLIGYFLLPGIFYLWMAFLGGGGMIALGVYVRYRW